MRPILHGGCESRIFGWGRGNAFEIRFDERGGFARAVEGGFPEGGIGGGLSNIKEIYGDGEEEDGGWR